jgi:hypothetical protein
VLADSTSRLNIHSTTTNRFTSSLLSQDNQYQCGTPVKSIDYDDGSSSKYRSSSVPRRQSFGGSGLLSRTTAVNSNSIETPIRDRRAVLEAWRKARGGDTSDADVAEYASSFETRKRTRGDPPLLPPSTKHYRTNLSQDHATTAFGQILHQNNHHRCTEVQSQSSVLSSNLTIDSCDNNTENHSTFTARTPSSRRGIIGSASRKSLMGRNIYHVNNGTWKR